MNPRPNSIRAASTPWRKLSLAAAPSRRLRSFQFSNGQSEGLVPATPKREAWSINQRAEKSGNNPSEKIFSKFTSIQAGRVRLALSRKSRSVAPSQIIPQSASSSAFKYSWSNWVAERLRVSSPNWERASSIPSFRLSGGADGAITIGILPFSAQKLIGN